MDAFHLQLVSDQPPVKPAKEVNHQLTYLGAARVGGGGVKRVPRGLKVIPLC